MAGALLPSGRLLHVSRQQEDDFSLSGRDTGEFQSMSLGQPDLLKGKASSARMVVMSPPAEQTDPPSL